MKIILLLVAALAVVGCGQNEAPRIPAETETSDSEYSPSAFDAEKDAQKRMALITVNEAVQGFRTLERRYPNNLDELVTGTGPLPSLPDLPEGMIFTYDREDGKVDVKEIGMEVPETEGESTPPEPR